MAVIEPDEFDRAVEGLRYFDLGEAADLLARLVESYGRPDHDYPEEVRLENMRGTGDPVSDAFLRKAAEVPSDFGV